jgi:hypothetical protein
MVEQVREAMEKANQQVYGGSGLVTDSLFHDTYMTLAWPENKICERRFSKSLKEKENLAPRARLELATLRLTAECSTVELPGNRATLFF